MQDAELRQLFDPLPAITIRDLRDRAPLRVFVYTFAGVSALVTMKVRDYRVSGRRADIHLQEEGRVVNRVPVHHKLREYLDEYIEAARLATAPESWLWRSMPGRKDDLSEKPMSRHDALQVVKRRCASANLQVDICCHSFRGSGITLYLQRGGTFEHEPRRSPATPIPGQRGSTTGRATWFHWMRWRRSCSEE